MLRWTGLGVAGVASSALLAACGGEAPSPTTAPAAPAGQAAKPTTAAAPAGATTAPAAAPTTAAAAQPKPATSEPVEINWEFRGDDVSVQGGQKAVDEFFTPENPNITVKIQVAPDQQRDEKLVAAMVAGTAPDVFESWTDNVTQYADRGQVLNVEDLVKRDLTAEDIQDFYEWQWGDFILPSGIRFGLPKYVNVMTLWVNVDHFEQAGQELPTRDWTHEEYATAARSLAKVSGTAQDVYGAWIPMWSWDRYWYRIEMFGGQVVNPQDTTESLLHTEESLAALEWARELEWDSKAMAQPLSYGGHTQPAIPQWAAQKWSMQEDGFYPFRLARDIQQGFRWQYQHIPQGPNGRKVLGTTDGFVIWSKSEQPDAAWELLKFLSGPAYQEALVGWSGSLPVRHSFLDKWKQIVLTNFPELEEANVDVGPEAMTEGYPGNRILFKNDAQARQIIQPALEKLYVSGNTPVTYMEEISEQVTQQQRKG